MPMDLDIHLRTLEQVLQAVDDQSTDQLVQRILAARVVHLAGEGRSGSILGTLASHLTELGMAVSLYGAPTSIRPRKNDFLLILSGSGKTPLMCHLAERAGQDEVPTGLVTSAVISPLTGLATVRILLAPPFLPSELNDELSDEGILQAMRVYFEESAFLYLSRLAARLRSETGQSAKDLESRRP